MSLYYQFRDPVGTRSQKFFYGNKAWANLDSGRVAVYINEAKWDKAKQVWTYRVEAPKHFGVAGGFWIGEDRLGKLEFRVGDDIDVVITHVIPGKVKEVGISTGQAVYQVEYTGGCRVNGIHDCLTDHNCPGTYTESYLRKKRVEEGSGGGQAQAMGVGSGKKPVDGRK